MTEIAVGSLVYIDFSAIPRSQERNLVGVVERFGKKALRVIMVTSDYPARLSEKTDESYVELDNNFYRWQIRYLRVVRDQAEVDQILEERHNLLTALKFRV